MSVEEIYFDNNATTRPYPEVVEAMMACLGKGFGNPSSSHSAGLRAKSRIDESRTQLSKLLGCEPSKVVFTSSGTESNNMAFYSSYRDNKDKCCILTTTVEHSSIKKMSCFLELDGTEIINLEVDSKGHIDLDVLDKLLKQRCISLVSVQWVNNETGVIQPIKEIGNICKNHGVLFHTDAAQAIGKIEFRLENLPIDFLSLTGHKFNSPQGIGAIYSLNKLKLNPIMFGGFQEDHYRPGTENVSGIVGIGKASEIRSKNLNKTISQMFSLREYFEERIRESIPCSQINGDPYNRVCNTSNFKFRGIDGRKLLSRLDSVGIRCSQSSACTNSSLDPSYVLLAMGLSPQQAYSSIRFSFSTNNTFEEIDRAIIQIQNFCEELKT